MRGMWSSCLTITGVPAEIGTGASRVRIRHEDARDSRLFRGPVEVCSAASRKDHEYCKLLVRSLLFGCNSTPSLIDGRGAGPRSAPAEHCRRADRGRSEPQKAL